MSDSLIESDLLNFAIPSARGGARKREVPLVLEYVRDLNAGDLDLILNPRALAIGTPAVKSLRASHHTLARMLAEGHKATVCSAVTGYSQSRISILQGDPAFAELMAYYQAQKAEIFIDVQKRLAALGIDTIEELHERLGTSPEKFSNKDLFALAELTLDRSVAPSKRADNSAGPNQANQIPVIQINFGSGRPESPTPVSTVLQSGPTIEGELVAVPTQQ